MCSTVTQKCFQKWQYIRCSCNRFSNDELLEIFGVNFYMSRIYCPCKLRILIRIRQDSMSLITMSFKSRQWKASRSLQKCCCQNLVDFQDCIVTEQGTSRDTTFLRSVIVYVEYQIVNFIPTAHFRTISKNVQGFLTCFTYNYEMLCISLINPENCSFFAIFCVTNLVV